MHGITSKQVTIENEAGNLLDFDVSRKTRIVRDKKQIPLSQLESGDVVTIEARQVMGRYLEAVSITVQREGEGLVVLLELQLVARHGAGLRGLTAGELEH